MYHTGGPATEEGHRESEVLSDEGINLTNGSLVFTYQFKSTINRYRRSSEGAPDFSRLVYVSSSILLA
jgi:hypothetical protein